MAHQIKDVALHAALEFAALNSLLDETHERMPCLLQAKVDELILDTHENGYFDSDVLTKAAELQTALLIEIENSGGAPHPARSDEGDLLWIGGSDTSRELSAVKQVLDRYINHARFVCIATDAEAELHRRRCRLGLDGVSDIKKNAV